MAIITFDPTKSSFDGSTSTTDTLQFNGTDANLSTITLNSVEILKALSTTAGTTFLVDQADLAKGGSVLGVAKTTDTLSFTETDVFLTSTTLSSIEVLQAHSTSSTVFHLDQADLAKGGSVIGSTSAADKIEIAGTSLDLTSTDLTNIEVLQAGSSKSTTFTLDQADLAGLTSIIGSDTPSTSTFDTLVVKGNAIDLTGVTLTEIQGLKVIGTTDTTITLDDELSTLVAITGTAKTDTLVIDQKGMGALTFATLSSVEILKFGNGLTALGLDQADLASKGSIIGGAGTTDTVFTLGTVLDLSSTTLTQIEQIATLNATGTVFTVNALGGKAPIAVTGSNGLDTLVVKSADIDLSAVEIANVETLKAGLATATKFTVVADAVNGMGGAIETIVGGAGIDSLTVSGSTIVDLSGVTLTSIEKLVGSAADSVTFKLDQADLAKGGSVIGTSFGADTIVAAGSNLDLTSTTVTDVEQLRSEYGGGDGTIFTVTKAQFDGFDVISGTNDTDTLILKSTSFDISSHSLSGIEVLQAGASGTTFTVDYSDLTTGKGDVWGFVGGTGKDVLVVHGTNFDLSNIALTSIDVLKADPTNGATGTEFRFDSQNITGKQEIIGNTGAQDTIVLDSIYGLDLSSATLTSIEKVRVDNGALTVTKAQFDKLIVENPNGDGGLLFASATVDLTSTTLDDFDLIGGGTAKAGISLRVKADQLLKNGTVTGNGGLDTLIIQGNSFDLTHTALNSIEKLVADTPTGTQGTLFTLDDADLADGGSVIGTKNIDTLTSASTGIDLTATTLTSIEVISTQTSSTIFLIDQADLAKNGSVTGYIGTDTLLIHGTGLDLTSTTLTSVEILRTDASKSTTFTVDQADLLTGGSVVGSVSGSADTLVVKGTGFDLTGTTITDIEVLKAGGATGTTFTLDQADINALGSGGQIVGGAGTDTIKVTATNVDLTSVTLTSVEVIKTELGSTSFLVDQADLAKGGSVVGSAGSDSLVIHGTALDLTSTTLTSIETLATDSTDGTTFTLDKGELQSGLIVNGNTGKDTLIVAGTNFDLSSTSFNTIETLKAGAAGTTFTLDDNDLKTLGGSGGQIVGGAGSDTIKLADGVGDFRDVTLVGIETLKGGSSGTAFLLGQDDLVKSIVGDKAGSDSLIFGNATSIDLTSTTLTSIEQFVATSATTFTMDQADVVASMVGGGPGSKLVIHGTSLDLTSASLNNFSTLTTDSAKGTTFTVDASDLGNLVGSSQSIVGGKGIDSLVVQGSSFVLAAIALDSIENLTAIATSAATFIVDGADLTALGSAGKITGTAKDGDTLQVITGDMDLTHITLTGIEKLALSTGGSIKLDQTDITALGKSGEIGVNGGTLVIHGTSLDLTGVTTVGMLNLTTDSTAATTFKLDSADLIGGATVTGSAASGDTLIVVGTHLDFRGNTLVGIETVKTGASTATEFSFTDAQIKTLSSVVGGAGIDSLTISNGSGDTIDLSKITLTGIEHIAGETQDGFVDLTVGGGVGGATFDLGSNAASDTISFTTDYKVGVTTSDATILAHTLAIDHFTDGTTNGDTLDFSDVVHGTPGMLTSVNVSGATTLKAALNLAAAGDGGASSAIVTFDFGGNTYVLVDNSASKTLTGDDVLVKLVGTHALSSDNVLLS
jgi:hypothetical protein